jgi:hypothetical protein
MKDRKRQIRRVAPVPADGNTHIYVSTAGHDRASGRDPYHPLRSLNEAMRRIKQMGLSLGNVVLDVGPGRHEIAAGLYADFPLLRLPRTGAGAVVIGARGWRKRR